jgi:hypothetical protein
MRRRVVRPRTSTYSGTFHQWLRAAVVASLILPMIWQYRCRRAGTPAVRAQLPRRNRPAGRRACRGGAADRRRPPDRGGDREPAGGLYRGGTHGLAGPGAGGVRADRGHPPGGGRPRAGQAVQLRRLRQHGSLTTASAGTTPSGAPSSAISSVAGRSSCPNWPRPQPEPATCPWSGPRWSACPTAPG